MGETPKTALAHQLPITNYQSHRVRSSKVKNSMSVPLLRLGDSFDSYTSGEVNIHPSAVIAPGVILQAAANSKIIIGPGVCIGMGTILQVSEGILEIEAGANLGAGFLMVGQGKVGANACIGASTTVFNCSIAPQQVVPPGSILGDTSRQIGYQVEPEPTDIDATSDDAPSTEPEPAAPEQKTISSTTQFSAAAFVELKHQSTSVSQPTPTPKSQSPPEEEMAQASDLSYSTTAMPDSTAPSEQESQPSPPKIDSPNSFGTHIYGQGSINRLLTTLFPHRQSLSDQKSDNLSE
jgi:carbon dioxide concentrating mechanism protein CcmN